MLSETFRPTFVKDFGNHAATPLHLRHHGQEKHANSVGPSANVRGIHHSGHRRLLRGQLRLRAQSGQRSFAPSHHSHRRMGSIFQVMRDPPVQTFMPHRFEAQSI